MQKPTNSQNPVYLAVDLGAGSGRVMAAWRDGADGAIRLEPTHRFRSLPRVRDGHLRWDFEEMLAGIFEGLRVAAERFGERIRSVSVDTWGVDFGLLDGEGRLLGDPLCYRAERHTAGVKIAEERIGGRRLYVTTGIQPLPFNTIFQLLAEVGAPDSRLGRAERLLFIPDLIHWSLCGVARNERTIASTGGLLDARSGDWAWDLLAELGLPAGLFCELVEPGTRLGVITPEVAKRTGLPANTAVVAGGAHDTASAVAAVPLAAADEVYLSSGTWSLIGVEHDAPVLDAAFAEAGFNNERGVGGTYRLLSNVIGLWMLEECRREWEAAGDSVDYATLLAEAEAAEPFAAQIDATAAEWIPPGGMPERLRTAIAAAGGPVDIARGGLVRTIFEGLAVAYRRQYARLESCLGVELGAIRIVGGGCQNALLNQMTADAIGKTVHAGPVEATSLGNVVVQMVADGGLGSIAEGRRLIERSFPTRRFEPGDRSAWDVVLCGEGCTLLK